VVWMGVDIELEGVGEARGERGRGLMRRGKVLRWLFCCRKASGERESISRARREGTKR
jgi:hypothetical protein